MVENKEVIGDGHTKYWGKVHVIFTAVFKVHYKLLFNLKP